MDEETLAVLFEDLNMKIDELINVQKETNQKQIAIINKLEKIQEYNEIDDMRSIMVSRQLSSIIDRLARIERYAR